MRKFRLLKPLVIGLVAVCCTSFHAQSQHLNDTVAYKHWAARLKEGKSQRTRGLIDVGIGAALATACALIESPKKEGGWGVSLPSVNVGQVVTGLGAFVFTTAGLINIVSGSLKLRRAKLELGKTSYLISPKSVINGPSLSLTIVLPH